MSCYQPLKDKIRLGLLLPILLGPMVLGVNALTLFQLLRIDLQGQLIEMGYLPGKEDGADMFIIPPRKPDFILDFSHKEA